jgi:hypothetical protein
MMTRVSPVINGTFTVPADLRHTEHYVFLAYTADGAHDTAHLEGGTRLQLNALAAALG